MSLRQKPARFDRAEKEKATMQICLAHIYHGVWYNPVSATLSVRRTILDQVEHLPWTEARAALAQHIASQSQEAGRMSRIPPKSEIAQRGLKRAEPSR